jgi:hypothetical protein
MIKTNKYNIENQFNEIKNSFSKNNTMCYTTSNEMFNKMTQGGKKCSRSHHDTIILKSSMSHLYNLIPSVTSIELNIATSVSNKKSKKNIDIRKKYSIESMFWVPRILNHSFNIIITPKKVIISQSWFKIMNYKVIYELNHKNFILWLDDFRDKIKNYKNAPMKVFDLFKFPHSKINDDIKNMFKYAKDSPKSIIQFHADYSYFGKLCD